MAFRLGSFLEGSRRRSERTRELRAAGGRSRLSRDEWMFRESKKHGWKMDEYRQKQNLAETLWNRRDQYQRFRDRRERERKEVADLLAKNNAWFDMWKTVNDKKRKAYETAHGDTKGIPVHSLFVKAARNADEQRQRLFLSMYPAALNTNTNTWEPINKSWTRTDSYRDLITLAAQSRDDGNAADNLLTKVELYTQAHKEGLKNLPFLTPEEDRKIAESGVKISKGKDELPIYNTAGSAFETQAMKARGIRQAAEGDRYKVNRAWLREFIERTKEVASADPRKRGALPPRKAPDKKAELPSGKPGTYEPLRKIKQFSYSPRSSKLKPAQIRMQRRIVKEIVREAKIHKGVGVEIKSHHIAAILGTAHAESSLGQKKNMFQIQADLFEDILNRFSITEKDLNDKHMTNLWLILTQINGGAFNDKDFLNAETVEEASKALTENILRPHADVFGRDIALEEEEVGVIGYADLPPLTVDHRAHLSRQFAKQFGDISPADADAAAVETVKKTDSLSFITSAVNKLAHKNTAERWTEWWKGKKNAGLTIDKGAFFSGIPSGKKLSDKELKKDYPDSYKRLTDFVEYVPQEYGAISANTSFTLLQKAERILDSYNGIRGRDEKRKNEITEETSNRKQRQDKSQMLPPGFFTTFVHLEDGTKYRVPPMDNPTKTKDTAERYIKTVSETRRPGAGEEIPTKASNAQISLFTLFKYDRYIKRLKDGNLQDKAFFNQHIKNNPAFINDLKFHIPNSVQAQAPGSYSLWALDSSHLPSLAKEFPIQLGLAKEIDNILKQTKDEVKKAGGAIVDETKGPNGWHILKVVPVNKQARELIKVDVTDPDILRSRMMPNPEVNYVPGRTNRHRNVRLSHLENSHILDALASGSRWTLGKSGQSLTQVQKDFENNFNNSITKLRGAIITSLKNSQRASGNIADKSEKYLSLFNAIEGMAEDDNLGGLIDTLLNGGGLIDLVVDAENTKIWKDIAPTQRVMIEGRFVPIQRITNANYHRRSDKEIQDSPEYKDLQQSETFAISARNHLTLLDDSFLMAGALQYQLYDRMGSEFKILMGELFKGADTGPRSGKKLIVDLNRIISDPTSSLEEKNQARNIQKALKEKGAGRLTEFGGRMDIFTARLHGALTVARDYFGSVFNRLTGVLDGQLDPVRSEFIKGPTKKQLGIDTESGITKEQIINRMDRAREITKAQFKKDMKAAEDGEATKQSHLKQIAMLSAHRSYRAIMLTYQFAGMIQGGQGGRAISNEDFEHVYKALWAGGTRLQVLNIKAAINTVDNVIKKMKIMKDTLPYGKEYTNKIMNVAEPISLAYSRYAAFKRYMPALERGRRSETASRTSRLSGHMDDAAKTFLEDIKQNPGQWKGYPPERKVQIVRESGMIKDSGVSLNKEAFQSLIENSKTFRNMGPEAKRGMGSLMEDLGRHQNVGHFKTIKQLMQPAKERWIIILQETLISIILDKIDERTELEGQF